MTTQVSKWHKKESDEYAIIMSDVDGYNIDYYENHTKFFSESFVGKSIYYVEDAAENWTLGIKKLNVK